MKYTDNSKLNSVFSAGYAFQHSLMAFSRSRQFLLDNEQYVRLEEAEESQVVYVQLRVLRGLNNNIEVELFHLAVGREDSLVDKSCVWPGTMVLVEQ